MRQRRIIRLAATLTCAAMLAFTAAPSTTAQQSEASRNFVHPPGTRTAPLGELGHIEQRGHGPVPVVLLPGAAFGSSVWEPFMRRNAERYTMYAVTPPGYEGTPPPPMPADPEDFSRHEWTDALLEAVVTMVREKGLDRPLLVGHHLMGDHYALRLGLEYPELFRGVVVIAGVPNRGDAAATVAEQIEGVETQWKPFFRDVTWERWLQGTYTADTLSNDPARGTSLYERQISVPLPTQLRYFLEYLTTNLSLELDRLELPLLVINQQVDFDAFVEEAAEDNAQRLGGMEAARERVKDTLEARYGSLEAAEEALLRPWEPLRGRVADMTVEYVDDTAVFIMDDRPQVVDRLVEEFVARLATGAPTRRLSPR